MGTVLWQPWAPPDEDDDDDDVLLQEPIMEADDGDDP